MKLPIVAYGHPALRKETVEINEEYPKLQELIDNMFETMYNANGIGLAAPQVGLSIRLFIVDGTPLAEDDEDGPGDKSLENFKKVFINPIIVEERGENCSLTEGCLSIPDISEEVLRQDTVVINYLNEEFEEIEEEYTGMAARIIQHEYDHIEGKLFVDKLSPLTKARVKRKLDLIKKGAISVRYPMQFVNLKKKRS
ncbi:MAG TPA: peptide deformylase [Candidatus Sphingobacterium stercoripullorum]|uniref:Peptide deformylase n=1 Tax=Candidatus Sphingobacterium stercoripullorum TaxID=2838759 RepID=A0A9D1W7Z7_9SPHI|nr:peptide deformylase [Candidatus Sphingobacterium stercoripullorum]HLR50174.1 peptide deformylase [Candidatus Sphingobacterium stercoripullorum]